MTHAGKAASQLVDVVNSNSILPFLDPESGEYESSYSSSVVAEVYMSNNNIGAAATDAATREAVDALLHTLVEGDSETQKDVEASPVVVLAEKQRLPEERAALDT